MKASRWLPRPAGRADEEARIRRLGEQHQGRNRGHPDLLQSDVGADDVARADGRVGVGSIGNPGKGVADGILFAGKILDVAEVELLQEFQPAKEPLREIRHSSEVFETFMITEDLERSADQEVTPDAEGLTNGQKFLLPSRVVPFRILELPGVEGDGVRDTVMKLVKRSTDGLMFGGGVRYDFRWQFRVKKL